MEENKTSQVEFQEENSVESSCTEEVKALTWKEKLKNMSKKQIAIFGGIAVAVIAIIIASIILLGGNNGDSSDGSENDGHQIRQLATENNVTIFTAMDTVKVLLDVLEETTLTISTIDS